LRKCLTKTESTVAGLQGTGIAPEVDSLSTLREEFVRNWTDSFARPFFWRGDFDEFEEEQFLESLRQYLTGEKAYAGRRRLSFVDIGSDPAVNSIDRFFACYPAGADTLSLDVVDTDAFKRLLEKRNQEYLLVITDLKATWKPSEYYPGGTIPGLGGYMGSWTAERQNLRVQVFIWGADTAALLWHGFIDAEVSYSGEFDKGDANRLARYFIKALSPLLKLRANVGWPH
jgi:hypothetical protein